MVMMIAANAHPRAPRKHDEDAVLNRLQAAIDHAAHLLPAQGPINVFIHHNTLHAFEGLTFAEAVQKGGAIFGCQPYLEEDRYREELHRGRIRFDELETILREDLGSRAEEVIAPRCTRYQLHLAMLQYPLRSGPTEELRWFVAETDALRRVRRDVSSTVRTRLIAETRHWVMRDLWRQRGEDSGAAGAISDRARYESIESLLNGSAGKRIEHWTHDEWESFTLNALWRLSCDGVEKTHSTSLTSPHAARHRDLLLQATGVDADLCVHDVLIRFCGAFLDQGLAHWPLPHREKGFLRSFADLYGPGASPRLGCLEGLTQEIKRWMSKPREPLELVRESLELLGIAEHDWDTFLCSTLLALRGWGGMLRFLEERPDRAVNPPPAGTLVEFLAVRLLLDRLALQQIAKEALGYAGPLSGLRSELDRLECPHPVSRERRAFLVFQVAQVLGLTPEDLFHLSQQEWSAFIQEIEAFSSVERRRLFHASYERRFTTQTLDALVLHARRPSKEPRSPRLQVMFCIDEREESLRRHLEEIAPDVVTYSIAGFYFIAMYYRGVSDAHFVPLCPPILRPEHWVTEKVEESHEAVHQRGALLRRGLGIASHHFHAGSRTFLVGAILSATVGVLASIPLLARTFLPRFSAGLQKKLNRLAVSPHLVTRLQIEQAEGSEQAFSIVEMADIAERILRDTGLTSNFARLVIMLGHGSISMNNPHESAHDCGACGGRQGGPNGRAAARILNDARVRELLEARGLRVPPETVFIGGMHNTSNDAITFDDSDLLPASHREEFENARHLLSQACQRNAHERCRRFESAPLELDQAAALEHVENRAEDLAQVRPEFGHATNAIVIVGRRQRTRGLFLDRRAFLNSYDPTQDDLQSSILTRILQAAMPVCAGISLEYYFSYVDNAGYGCGTKLPHNIASLLGVMDGAASDLRTGLPWQMVEIHEPVRILFVIETRPGDMLAIMDRNPDIARWVRHEWVQLAVLDPLAPTIHLFRSGKFEEYEAKAERLPTARSSVDWYRGWRDHLEFAAIGD